MNGHAALDLEHFLPYRLSVLSNTISQAIAREYAERFDLSVTEWRVIAVLGRYPELSAVEVADRTAMDKVAVSRALTRLIGSRRVKRTVDDADRRRSVLELTARGRKVYDEVVPRALELERRLIGPLDAEERAWLDRILGKLADQGLRALRSA